MEGMCAFCLTDEVRPKQEYPKAYTNEWVDDDAFVGILTAKKDRKTIAGHYSNVFVAFKGADNKVSFMRTLNKFYMDLKEQKRRVIVENGIDKVSPNEIGNVKRGIISDIEGLINALEANLADIGYLRHHFREMIMELYKANQNNLQRTTNKAVLFKDGKITSYHFQLTKPVCVCVCINKGPKHIEEASFLYKPR